MLEKGYYIEKNEFWNVLCDILQFDAKLINLYKITSDYNKFKMIQTMDIAPTKINILKQFGVFNFY